MIAAVGVLTAAAGVRAAEPLRWKFAPNEQLDYEITGATAISLGQPPSVYRLRQQLDVTWRVQQVDDAGGATIEQTVRRVRLELDDPLGTVEYDSQTDDEPSSLAALLAPVFEAVLEHPIGFKLSARGEPSDVQLLPPLLEAVANVPLAKALGQFASEEGLRGLLIPRLPKLPEGKIKPDQQWSQATESVNQLSGWAKVETTYRYSGERQEVRNTGDGDEEGITLAEIAIEPKVTFAANEKSSVKVSDEQSSGALLFDRSFGRLKSCRWNLKIDVAVDGAEGGTLEQQFRMEHVRQKPDDSL